MSDRSAGEASGLDSVGVVTKPWRHDWRHHPLRMARLWIALRVWKLWIPALARQPDLAPLLDATAAPPVAPYRGLAAESVARQIRRAVRRPHLMADRPCLREGLLLRRFLSMAGYAPEIHFGIDRKSLGRDVHGHCWITLDGRTYNPPEAGTIEIYTIPASALMTAAPSRREV